MKTYIEPQEVNRLEGATTNLRDRLLVRIACPQCGVPLGKNNIFCPKCGTKVKEALSGEKESRRVRTLPLDRDTLQMVKDYIKRGGP